MRRSNLIIAVYLVLIFASGVVVGAFASRLYSPTPVSSRDRPGRLSPEEYRSRYIHEMQTRLNLTPAQLTELNGILDNTGAKVHAAHERRMQEMKAIHEEQMSRVRAILTPAQRPEYDQFVKERAERARPKR